MMGGPMQMPKMEVVVDGVAQEDVQLYTYVEGKTVPYKTVDIRARVAGYLEALYFRSGAIVKQGDKLAMIEQEQYDIALEAAKAEQANAEAREVLAKSNLERGKQLVESRALSPEEFQSRQAEYDMAKAAVALSKANVRNAELNLRYTEMYAPIPGKTTNNLIDIGNYINPSGGSSVLLNIAQMDPIYVDFTLSDRQFADLKERMSFFDVYEKSIEESKGKPGTANAAGGNETPFQQTLPALNGNYDVAEKQTVHVSRATSQDFFSVDYPLEGKIVSLIDNEINWETASIMLRAEVRNPLLKIRGGNEDYFIYPGQACRVRIPHEKVAGAILVHEEAILTDLDTKYVLIIEKEMVQPRNMMGQPLKDKDGKDLPAEEQSVVHRRDIKIGQLLDTQMRIVESGLKKGETYIVKGVQRARIGVSVTTTTLEEFNKRRGNAGAAPKVQLDGEAAAEQKAENQPVHGEIVTENE